MAPGVIAHGISISLSSFSLCISVRVSPPDAVIRFLLPVAVPRSSRPLFDMRSREKSETKSRAQGHASGGSHAALNGRAISPAPAPLRRIAKSRESNNSIRSALIVRRRAAVFTQHALESKTSSGRSRSVDSDHGPRGSSIPVAMARFYNLEEPSDKEVDSRENEEDILTLS